MAAFAQTRRMKLYFNTGSVITFNLEDLDSLVWEVDEVDAPYNDEDEQTVTGNASGITAYTATISSWANNIRDNEATDLKVGIIYGTMDTPNKSNGTQKTVSLSSIADDGAYTVSLTGLSPSTTYYYRSFVYQSGIWWYGKIRSFTTKSQGVSFTTGAAKSVTCFSAKITSAVNIASTTQYSSLTYGVCYGQTAEPTTSGSKVQGTNRDASGSYDVTLRALAGNTTYYYRPYAIVDGYVSYGPVSTFTTKEDNVVTTGTINTDTQTVSSVLKIGGGAYSTLQLGVCYAQTPAPTVSNSSVTSNEVDDETHAYTVTLPITRGTWYYRAYVLIDGTAHYGETKSVELTYTNNDTKEAVDLGLSVKWATCNVGAKNPEEYGDYFAWGETEPKSDYSWSTYKWCNGSPSTLTKYNNDSSYGTVDRKTTLEPADDAATVNWGGAWRMPTHDEQLALIDSCYWEWTTNYNDKGVSGYIVYKVKNSDDMGKKKTSGSSITTVASYSLSDTHIFLPAAGRRGTSLGFAGSNGYYWSASLGENYPSDAWFVSFGSGSVGSNSFIRGRGRSVRPVFQD